MPPMMRHLISRLITACLSVLGAMLLIFLLVSLVPGDPATALLGPLASPEFAKRFVIEMGLDQPFYVRLCRFLGQALSGNLGTDVVTGQRVSDVVINALPHTFVLAIAAMTLACVTGIPCGIYSAVNKGAIADTLIAMVSVVFVSVPSFILGMFLLVIFTLWLDWLPVLGIIDHPTLKDQILAMILPTVALALGWVGLITRLVRSSMLDILGQNYIRTAHAYGLSQRLILYKYALKNAIIPTLAIIGMGVGRLLGGAVLIEILFARQGLGAVLYNALQARNFSVLQGTVFIVVIIFVVVNLLIELSYSLFDPRIRHSRR